MAESEKCTPIDPPAWIPDFMKSWFPKAWTKMDYNFAAVVAGAVLVVVIAILTCHHKCNTTQQPQQPQLLAVQPSYPGYTVQQ